VVLLFRGLAWEATRRVLFWLVDEAADEWLMKASLSFCSSALH
jgi:hypothetical protein